jgi:hypothetical protein
MCENFSIIARLALFGRMRPSKMMRRTIGVRRLHHRMVRRWAIDGLPSLRLAGTELAY